MIQKYYIVECKEFLDELNEIDEISKKRNEFIKDFFGRKCIEGGEYYMRGNGRVNVPFNECDKEEICLCIQDTEKNRELFGSQYKKNKPLEGLCDLRKKSALLKEFQNECIEKRIAINLHGLREGDYFKELHYGGYSVSRFKHNGNMYLSISSPNSNTKDITPEYKGFIEIKGSEFHTALEQVENK